jgi:hypothetical protein
MERAGTARHGRRAARVSECASEWSTTRALRDGLSLGALDGFEGASTDLTNTGDFAVGDVLPEFGKEINDLTVGSWTDGFEKFACGDPILRHPGCFNPGVYEQAQVEFSHLSHLGH